MREETTIDAPAFGEAACRLVAGLGRPEFEATFLDLCDSLIGARQVAAFRYDGGRLRCVLAHRPADQTTVERLCRRYTRGLFARDPLLAGFVGSDGVRSARLSARDIADDTYRHRLFADGDLSAKAALTAARAGHLVYLNFYFRAEADLRAAGPGLTALGPLLVESLRKHHALGGVGDQPPPARAEAALRERFPTLSAREAECAALIACGYGTDAIAGEMGIAPSSVATLRKRAYAKMGIADRAELFARLAGLAV